jgi:predicted enzyme related to lactoylglutathione lyase
MASTTTLISIYCDDLPAMRAFYTERVGLEVVPFLSNESDFIFLKAASGTPIALRASSGRPAGMPSTPGCIEVGWDVPDIQAVYDDFKAAGVAVVTEIADMGAGLYFVAKDPAGNYLSVTQLNDMVRASREQMGQ